MHWADVATAVTAVGALLGGLALPLAFVQLGALRQDRLRAQVGKIGAWARAAGQPLGQPGPVEWGLQILIRNSSELPVTADTAELSVRPWGYNLIPTDNPGESVSEKRFGDTEMIYVAPGTIAPGETWSVFRGYEQKAPYDRPQPPMVTISRVVITDAAGYQWEMRPRKAGPPRRVHRWRRWWWRRTGKL